MSRKSLDISEMKLRVFQRDDYICQNCGKYLLSGVPQMAHLIAKSKANLKKYGAEIIHHPFNLASVCCVEPCNSAMNIGNNPEAVRELVERIKEDLE